MSVPETSNGPTTSEKYAESTSSEGTIIAGSWSGSTTTELGSVQEDIENGALAGRRDHHDGANSHQTRRKVQFALGRWLMLCSA